MNLNDITNDLTEVVNQVEALKVKLDKYKNECKYRVVQRSQFGRLNYAIIYGIFNDPDPVLVRMFTVERHAKLICLLLNQEKERLA